MLQPSLDKSKALDAGGHTPAPLSITPVTMGSGEPLRKGFWLALQQGLLRVAGRALVGFVALVGLASFAYVLLTHTPTFIALEISPQITNGAVTPGAAAEGIGISGIVLHRGKPVASGNIELTVADARTTHHLASGVLTVADNGKFSTGRAFDHVRRDRQLRVEAHYWGHLPDSTSTSGGELEAERTVYSNCSAPITRENVLGCGLVLIVAVVVVITLFTMDIDQLRAPFLFAASYFITFLSVTFPLLIIVYVSQSPYLIEIMKDSPVGLVRARTERTLEEPQWLLNLGGLVESDTQRVRAGNNPDRAPAEPPADSRSAPSERLAPGEIQAPPAAAKTAALATPAQTDAEPAPAHDEAGLLGTTLAQASGDATKLEPASVSLGRLRAEPVPPGEPPIVNPLPMPALVVRGGLAIPFYAIMLAIFGAGINMMRRIPQIQAEHVQRLPVRMLSGSAEEARSSASQRPSTVVAGTPAGALGASRDRDPACTIRQEVIEQHMYLLAAPFLAVAVYYLLQIIANDVAQPVIVLMAFSAGLISEGIVVAIIAFANKTLGNKTKEEPGLQRAAP